MPRHNMGTPQQIGKRISAVDEKVNKLEMLLTKLDNFVRDPTVGVVGQLNWPKEQIKTFEQADIVGVSSSVKSLEQRIAEIDEAMAEQDQRFNVLRSTVELSGDLMQCNEHDVGLLTSQVEDL